MRETGLKQVFYLNTEYIIFVQSVLGMKFIKEKKKTLAEIQLKWEKKSNITQMTNRYKSIL